MCPLSCRRVHHDEGHFRVIRLRWRSIVFFLLFGVSFAPISWPEDLAEPSGEVLDMSPQSPVPWGLRYLTAPLISIVRGSDYMYAAREVAIETTPAGGYLDLFYVRAGFQKRFEQAEAPLTILLPSRLETGSRDSLTIRAFAEGYRQKSITLKLRGKIGDVKLDLAPLPNRLDNVASRYFAGRTAVLFLTTEALTFRLQEANDGYGIILTETAISEDARASVSEIKSPLIADSYSQQLGEDLMVKLVMVDDLSSLEVRSKQSYDAPRDLHIFSVNLVPSGSETDRVERATEALGRLSYDDVSECALEFDNALRKKLDPGHLARALRPSGDFTDRYLRAAMRRMGALSPDGSIEFVDGTRLRPGSTIELELAMSKAAGARGFLAFLRSFVAGLESDGDDRVESLRSLLAPELRSNQFGEILSEARVAEAACLRTD